MFKKQLIIVLAIGLVLAGLLGFSAVSVMSSQKEFPNSGYVHTSNVENSTKRILFDGGSSYKKKAGNQITFDDILGDKNDVDKNNFIHYDDNSLSSFADGVLVDLEDLSDNPAINHYAVANNSILEKSGSTYSVKNSTIDFAFKDFVWKVDENKYMVVSPTMHLQVADDDIKNFSNYAEISYIGDSLIQIQTEENIWQTISDNCHLVTDDGFDIDLASRNVSVNDPTSGKSNVLLEFNRIVLDSNNNIEIGHMSDEISSYQETVIPHFSITAENGADGLSGQPGESGDVGQAGNPGNNGRAGSPGVNGGPGPTGPSGDSEEIEGEVYDFPIFTIKEWTVDATSCWGKLYIVDNVTMLVIDDGYVDEVFGLYLVDMSTGERLFVKDSSGNDKKGPNAWNFYQHRNDPEAPVEFRFEGLIPNHTYMLHVNALTQIDMSSDPYVRSYVSKTFYTDSVGMYMEPAAATISSVSFNIIKRNYVNENFYVYYKVFNSLEAATAVNMQNSSSYNVADWDPYNAGTEGWEWLDGEGSPATYKYWNCIYPNTDSGFEGDTVELTHDQKLFVRMAYAYGTPCSATKTTFDDISEQVLELSTLKLRATVDAPILSVNRLAWGFDITTGTIYDPDSGIISYTYEFYNSNKFVKNSAGEYTDELIAGAQPDKVITRYDSSNSSISLDEVYLKSKTPYRVRAIAKFNDNEKTYNIYSGFSNSVELAGSVRPTVYFSALIPGGDSIDGTYVQLPFYDSAYGYLYVNPGANGSRLMMNKNGESSFNAPQVTFSLNGYYEATYVVYDSSDPAISSPESIEVLRNSLAGKNILIGETLADGRVKIYFPDVIQISGVTSSSITGADCACGLQPGKRYDISIVGDLSEDGSTVSETMVDIGRCQVMTSALTPIAATWSTQKTQDALQNCNIKLSQAELGKELEFNREKQALSSVTLSVYTTEYRNEAEVTAADAATTNAKRKVRRTLDASNAIDKGLIDSLFSEDGLTLTSAFFSSSPTLSDELAANPKLTVSISAAYDYTYLTEYRQNQEKYKSVSQTDKNYNPNSATHYYINEFEILDIYTTITSIRGLEPITGQDWGNNEAKDDGGIHLEAGYSNQKQSINNGYVTYYVFDAVDFYAGDKIQPVESSKDAKGYYTKYTYNGKTYNVNQNMYYWANYSDGTVDTRTEADRPIKALNYATPVHLEGLALGTVTIPVAVGQSTPTAIFYPMSKANYFSTKGIPESQTNGDNDYYLFYDDAHATEEERGHQFVFAYTVYCHTEDEGVRYVYPFDSYVFDSNRPADSRDVYYENWVFNEDDGHRMTNEPLKGYDGTTLVNCDYVQTRVKDPDRGPVLGYDAYMLIPHTTFTSLPEADQPRNEAQGFALQWKSNFKNTNLNAIMDTSSTITMRACINDGDNAVYKANDASSATGKSADLYLYQDVRTGSTPSYIKWDSAVTSNNVKIPVSDSTSINTTTVSASLLRPTPIAGDFAYSEFDLLESEVRSQVSNLVYEKREVIGMMPIQRYNNKYTNFYYESSQPNKEVHVHGNAYTEGSVDGNYVFYEYRVTNSKQLYQELFETKYQDVYDWHIDDATGYADRTTDDTEVLATYRWLMNDGVKDSLGFEIIGDKELLQNAVGVRIHFSAWDKAKMNEANPKENDTYGGMNTWDWLDANASRSFYVDKWLADLDPIVLGSDVNIKTPFRDSYAATQYTTHGKTVATPYILSFKVSVTEELAKNLTDLNNSMHVYDFSNINPSTYGDGTATMTPTGQYTASRAAVKVDITLLYASNDYGYDQIGSQYDGKTFALTSLRRDAGNKYTDERLYHLGNTQYYGFKTTTNLTTTPTHGLTPAIGSFLRIRRNSGNQIGIISTRHWQKGTTESSNQLVSQRSINTLAGLTQEMFLPVELVESGRVNLIDANTGDPVFDIDMPEAPPTITYTSHTTSRKDATIEYMIASADPTMYFTISDGNNQPDVATGQARYYQVSGSGNKISSTWTDMAIPGTTGMIDDHPTYNDSTDPLHEYMVPVNGTDLSVYFSGLEANHNYVVTCWRWTVLSESGSNKTYGFKRIDMEGASGVKEPNWHTFRTDDFPPANLDDSKYIHEEDDQKFLRVNLDMEAFTTNMYDVIYLYEKNESGGWDFKTVVYCGQTANTDLYFDLDNVTSSSFAGDVFDPQRTPSYTGRMLYQFDTSDLSTSGLPDSGPMCELEYGKTYKIEAAVYKTGTGPAWGSTTYDYVRDPDNEFKDYDHGIDKTPSYEFTIPNGWDYITRITGSSLVEDGKPSTMSFNIPAMTLGATTIKGNYAAPIITWKHYTSEDKSTYDLYDITSFVYVNSTKKNLNDASVNGLINIKNGEKLTFEFSQIKDEALKTFELRKFVTDNAGEVQLAIGDEISCYLYAYQGGNLTIDAGGSSGTVAGSIVGEPSYFTPSLVLGGTNPRFTPGYDDTQAIKLADETNGTEFVAKLTSNDFTDAGYPHSRRMSDVSTRTVENVEVSAGNVSITVMEVANLVLVQFDNCVAPTAIKQCVYSISARTMRTVGANVEYDTKNLGTADAPLTIPMNINPATMVRPYNITLPINAIMSSLQLGEQVISWQITMYFTSTAAGVSPEKVVYINDTNLSEGIDVVSWQAGSKLTYSSSKDVDVTTSAAPNLFRNFLNKMFGDDEDREDGATNE